MLVGPPASPLSAAPRCLASDGRDKQQPAKWRETLMEVHDPSFICTSHVTSHCARPQVAGMCVSPTIDDLSPSRLSTPPLFGDAGSRFGSEAAAGSDDDSGALSRPDARVVQLAALAARGYASAPPCML